MQKKIRTDQLRVGMYVCRLDRDWLDHSFLSGRFAINDRAMIARLAAEGIAHVVIDTDKGLDLPEEMDAEPAPLPPPVAAAAVAQTAHIASVAEESGRARAIYGEATQVVKNLMGEVRLGRRVDLAAVEPITERMIASVVRNPHALSSVSRIKSKDQYTFMHSVGVATIMIAFARHLGLSEAQIRDRPRRAASRRGQGAGAERGAQQAGTAYPRGVRGDAHPCPPQH